MEQTSDYVIGSGEGADEIEQMELANEGPSKLEASNLGPNSSGLKCPYCMSICSNEKELKAHKIFHLKKCIYCNEVMERRRLAIHFKAKCETCRTRFSCQTKLKTHVCLLQAASAPRESSETDEITVCRVRYCKWAVLRVRDLDKHYEKCHKNRAVKCPQCRKWLATKSCLKMHNRLFHEDGSDPGVPAKKTTNALKTLFFKCQNCSHMFLSEESREKHVSESHKPLHAGKACIDKGHCQTTARRMTKIHRKLGSQTEMTARNSRVQLKIWNY